MKASQANVCSDNPHNSPRLGQVGLDLNLDLTDTTYLEIPCLPRNASSQRKATAASLKGQKEIPLELSRASGFTARRD